jgi:hypothetical protein
MAETATGSCTIPTICNSPLGARQLKYRSQSSETFTVLIMAFNCPRIDCNAVASFESTTLVAPIAMISSCLDLLELKATTSQPQYFRNCKARWPNPPIPITPTLSVGLISADWIALKTVIPPHNNGPAFAISMPCGSGMIHDQWPRTISAKPPCRPTMTSSIFPQKWWSPDKQCMQCIQDAENQPSPTWSPTFTPFTSLPIPITSPTISWPGTSGYFVQPQSLFSIFTSDWHKPQ